MHIIMGKNLIDRISRYNKDYYCIIEKVQFLPGKIRVFIDERGNNSLGPLQDPMFSKTGIQNGDFISEIVKATGSEYSISNELSQYFGWLDFSIPDSFLNNSNIISFQYGQQGYSIAKLFRFDEELIERCSSHSSPTDTHTSHSTS